MQRASLTFTRWRNQSSAWECLLVADVLITSVVYDAMCVCSDSGLHVPSSVTGQLSAVSTATSQDQAAINSWLWQQYTAAAAASGSTTDQFVPNVAADPLQPNAVDAMTNGGGVIVYQLNADGTQTAAYAANSMPTSSDMLEPGEVRLPLTTGQTNGVAAAEQLYNNTAGVGVDYQPSAATPWLRQAVSGGTSVDSEKQLLRGALVDKVREIQRLTRELEQAYALIHQLKQHNEFLNRQWGQMHVASDAAQ